ncbi:hypothetical protein VTL71DRAFT_16120 [Oculimacula yallundae]|uniref:Uncharacterized protein n=1 Tax=Oculimacula yallundae TaxID=86028 RepID=A0ABR4CE97_9HELO
MDLGAGAVFGAINTAFKFSEFAIELAEVGSENNVFVRTIQRVRLDLDETKRLLRVPAIEAHLVNNPQKLFWIEQAINSTKWALNDIGLFVERVRSDQDRDDTVSFLNRVRWVLNDHGKLDNRRAELATCHQTLTTVLNTLHPVEMLASFSPTIPSPTMAAPPTYESVSQVSDFMSPYNRKKRRMKVLETEIREPKVLSGPVFNEEIPSVGPGVARPLHDELASEMARLEIRDVSSSIVLSSISMTSASSIQSRSISNAEASVESHPQISNPPRPDSCTGTNSSGPINSWDLWKDYLERPSFPVSGGFQNPQDQEDLKSPLDDALFSDRSIPVMSPSSVSLMSFELEDTQSPGMSQTSFQHSYSSTSTQEVTLPSELDGLGISDRPTAQLPTPQNRTRPMSTPLSGIYELGFDSRPAPRRNTSFQPSSSQVNTSGGSSQYKAYSEPHIPQLRPGFTQREAYTTQPELHSPQKRETYPPPRVLPYPDDPPERPFQNPVSQVAPPFCPYPTDRTSIPASLSTYSYLRRATSPALSFTSEVSAVESVRSNSEIPAYMHPASLRPGLQMKRTAVSQSRRRRALMEAALGVIGEK